MQNGWSWLCNRVIFGINTSGKAVESITDITPSNVSPVTISSGTVYKASGNGKALASITDITPQDSAPPTVTQYGVYKPSGTGYVVKDYPQNLLNPGTTISSGKIYYASTSGCFLDDTYTSARASNTSPPKLVHGKYYQISGTDSISDGYLINNYSSVTPSNSSPVSVSTNWFYKPSASGYVIASYNDVTPSNSSPVALTSGDIDKMGGNGYAIESYSSVTPSDASPVSLTSGSIYKMGGAGYAFASSHPQFAVTNPSTSGTSARVSTYTISNKNGKKLLVLLFDARNTAQTSTKMDSATCSGGTLTKLCNLSSSNIQVAGTVYNLTVSSNTCTITLPNDGYVQVFEQ